MLPGGLKDVARWFLMLLGGFRCCWVVLDVARWF